MNNDLLKRIQGCLVGGAVGDALGYPVEFMNEAAIFGAYPGGIQAFAARGGKAVISDDTQMTLFTACGMLNSLTAARLDSIYPHYRSEKISDAYFDWYATQNFSYNAAKDRDHSTWLWHVPELYAARAPGITCMNTLGEKMNYTPTNRYRLRYRTTDNHSKGCGGVMRIAPVALYNDDDLTAIMLNAENAAALTHGHPLGYMPAAMMANIIHRCVFARGEDDFRTIVMKARGDTAELNKNHPCIEDLSEIVDRAITLSENDDSDLENIHRLGEGWVAEEAFAIALYCCLRYPDDFDRCVIAAVNHKGDSDSTGAIAGNMLGAWLGTDAIGAKWTEELELFDVISELAGDLYALAASKDPAICRTKAWQEKYIDLTYTPHKTQ